MALRIPEGGQASDLRRSLAGELLEWWCSGSEADQVLFRCDSGAIESLGMRGFEGLRLR